MRAALQALARLAAELASAPGTLAAMDTARAWRRQDAAAAASLAELEARALAAEARAETLAARAALAELRLSVALQLAQDLRGRFTRPSHPGYPAREAGPVPEEHLATWDAQAEILAGRRPA